MSRRMDRERVSRARCGGFPVGMGLERIPKGDAVARMLDHAAAMRRLRISGLHHAALDAARLFRTSKDSFAIVAMGTRPGTR